MKTLPDGNRVSIRSVLRHLDLPTLRDAARRESRARQRHLPPISAYRWWARRTETVSGAVIDAVNADIPGRLTIADTFAGGGVIALAGLLRGHQVYAQDVNPWAANSLSTMIDLPAAGDIANAANRLHENVRPVLERAYATALADGIPASLAHTLRVATAPCPGCGIKLRLFPAALVSQVSRVDCGGDTGYVACRSGHLNFASAIKRSSCAECGRYIKPRARYTSDRVAHCSECGWSGKLAELFASEGFSWEVALVERCADGRREIGLPSGAEVVTADSKKWRPNRPLPQIEPGIETSVLLRHGMHGWHDLYPARQRVVIEKLLDACNEAALGDDRVARVLTTAVIGSTEMAGYACRWDPRYLKAYESIANHRFNVTTLTVEPNVWGTFDCGRGTVTRRLDQLAKAAIWLDEHLGRQLNVPVPKAATARRSRLGKKVDAQIVSGSSDRLCVPAATFDAVVTDPPYHDDVHYGELSDIFRAWAGEPTGAIVGDAIVRRLNGESGTDAYQALLLGVFTEIRRTLKPHGRVILSYANRHPGAWMALFSALEESGFQALGYSVVHSENETDHAKVGRRACTLDVLIEVVPATERPVHRFSPTDEAGSSEEIFCHVVGRWALDIGKLGDNWRSAFKDELDECEFLA